MGQTVRPSVRSSMTDVSDRWGKKIRQTGGADSPSVLPSAHRLSMTDGADEQIYVADGWVR